MANSQIETAILDWRDGSTPVSRRFDDPYFSIHNGLAEARHVFLDGNGLPARVRGEFQIGELGFGTGLNLLALWQACQSLNPFPDCKFTSFEAFPMTSDDMERALSVFPEIASQAEVLLAHWRNGARRFQLEGIEVEIVVGDAAQCLPFWQGHADAWFLDGFSPAKNPELWSNTLMHEVAAHTKPGGTFATYTAAGHVRRFLQDAGFSVDRRPGFGRKRHMTIGMMEPAK